MASEDGSADYGATADFYDFAPTYRERADVEFYVEAAKATGGPVLELGCGTGRILIPTARAGIEIIGLDLSRAMLKVCQSSLDREAPQVQSRARLIRGDMRAFDLGRQFPLITLPFRSFQHIVDTKDQIGCLHAIRKHLLPGGRVILDLFNPSIPMLADEARDQEWGGEPEAVLPDGRRVLRRFRVASRDYHAQVQDTELIYYVTHPDGRQERLVHRFPLRYLFRFEAEHLLARCGFHVDAVYSDYERHPYGSTYPGELIFMASA